MGGPLFFGKSVFRIFDLIPMALVWSFFFLAVETFVQDLYNRFYLFSQLWTSLWTPRCQWKDLEIEDLRQVICALYLARKIKQIIHRRNTGANTE